MSSSTQDHECLRELESYYANPGELTRVLEMQGRRPYRSFKAPSTCQGFEGTCIASAGVESVDVAEKSPILSQYICPSSLHKQDRLHRELCCRLLYSYIRMTSGFRGQASSRSGDIVKDMRLVQQAW